MRYLHYHFPVASLFKIQRRLTSKALVEGKLRPGLDGCSCQGLVHLESWKRRLLNILGRKGQFDVSLVLSWWFCTMFTIFRKATHMHIGFSVLSAPEGFSGRNVHSSTAERTWERTRCQQETRPTSGHHSQISILSRFDVVSEFYRTSLFYFRIHTAHTSFDSSAGLTKSCLVAILRRTSLMILHDIIAWCYYDWWSWTNVYFLIFWLASISWLDLILCACNVCVAHFASM